MKRRLSLAATVVLALALAAMLAVPVPAQGQARLRVVHASPDAPPVDVLVNNNVAFSNVPYKGITPYGTVNAGSTNVKVIPAGRNQPAVIDTTTNLVANTDNTIVAVGQLANIEPLVLTDDNTLPPAGQAKVRFVHASPNAPAVDVAVQNGPVLFSNISFKQVGNYVTVPAATVTLEVRQAGTSNVVLTVPNVQLNQRTVYTVYAVGLLNGQPPLEAIISLDAAPGAPAPPVAPGAPAATATPTRTGTPTKTRTLTATPTGTRTVTATATPTRTKTKTVTRTPTATGTKTVTRTPTATGTKTVAPTVTGAVTPSVTAPATTPATAPATMPATQPATAPATSPATQPATAPATSAATAPAMATAGM